MIFIIFNDAVAPEDRKAAFVEAPAHFGTWFEEMVTPIVHANYKKWSFIGLCRSPKILGTTSEISWTTTGKSIVQTPNDFVRDIFPHGHPYIPTFTNIPGIP